MMPIPGDPETFPRGWEQKQHRAAGSRPHSAAAECSETSHCEKNEQIIGFSVSSKGARARPRHCAAPWEEPPGRSRTSRPALQPQGCSQLQSIRLRANGDWGPESFEGTRLAGTTGFITTATKGKREDAKARQCHARSQGKVQPPPPAAPTRRVFARNSCSAAKTKRESRQRAFHFMLLTARARTHRHTEGMERSHLLFCTHMLAPARGRAAAPGEPGVPRPPTTAQGQPRDHLEAHLKSSHVPASLLHFSSDGLSAVTFPTAIDRKHFIAFPGGRILGVGLISVSMVTSSGLVKDLAFLGCCWVVETGGWRGAGAIFFVVVGFAFFFFF